MRWIGNVIIKNVLKELNGLQLMNDNLEKQREYLRLLGLLYYL